MYMCAAGTLVPHMAPACRSTAACRVVPSSPGTPFTARTAPTIPESTPRPADGPASGRVSASPWRSMRPHRRAEGQRHHRERIHQQRRVAAGSAGRVCQRPHRRHLPAVAGRRSAAGRPGAAAEVDAADRRLDAFVANVLQPGIADELAVRTRIEHMLSRRRFRMVCQPIVEIDTGRLLGAEALARFAPPPRQPPDAWFADAARAGLGVALELATLAQSMALPDRLPPQTFIAITMRRGPRRAPARPRARCRRSRLRRDRAHRAPAH